MLYKQIFRSLLFRMDPENAHDKAMALAMKVNDTEWMQNFVSSISSFKNCDFPVQYKKLAFRNPIGLAAGFDKNGMIPKAIHSLGFGFTEIGSITANKSSGNSKPRMFRLSDDNALINRMGLNNHGAKEITKRLAGLRIPNFPIGINISKTHDPAILGDKAIEDYLISYRLAEEIANYITINISCPNTKEGKTFESPDALLPLLEAIASERKKPDTPVLIKVSSDISIEELTRVAESSLKFGMNGFVAVNTSTDRSQLKADSKSLQSIGNGGLSGEPIFNKMLVRTQHLREISGDDALIISVGGIRSFDTAKQALEAGANLIQMYTALVYEGPFLASEIAQKLKSL